MECQFKSAWGIYSGLLKMYLKTTSSRKSQFRFLFIYLFAVNAIGKYPNVIENGPRMEITELLL